MELVVSGKGWTERQVDFVRNVWWDVHPRISRVGSDMDVGLATIENRCRGNGLSAQCHLHPIKIVEIVDAKA